MPRSHMSLEVLGLSWFSLFCSAGVGSAGSGSVAAQGRGKSGELQAQVLRLLVRNPEPLPTSGCSRQAAWFRLDGSECSPMLLWLFGCEKFILVF